jgi:hypothetical protein
MLLEEHKEVARLRRLVEDLSRNPPRGLPAGDTRGEGDG